jgi:hypothetical protein
MIGQKLRSDASKTSLLRGDDSENGTNFVRSVNVNYRLKSTLNSLLFFQLRLPVRIERDRFQALVKSSIDNEGFGTNLRGLQIEGINLLGADVTHK